MPKVKGVLLRNCLNQTTSMTQCPIRTAAHKAGCAAPSKLYGFLKLLSGVRCRNVLSNRSKKLSVIPSLSNFMSVNPRRTKQSKMMVRDSRFFEMLTKSSFCESLLSTNRDFPCVD